MGWPRLTEEELADRPRCKCHDEPMYSHGARWECAVMVRRSNAKSWAKRSEINRRAASDRSRDWKRANPERAKLHQISQRYGLSAATYEEMLLRQEYACAICGEKTDDLCVDHDHDTDEVRGLLCRKCNSGIGLLCDDPQLLRRALVYLEGDERP